MIRQNIIRKWKYCTQNNHGEFLSTRRKRSTKNKNDNYDCIQYNIECQTCYLFTIKETNKEHMLKNLEYWFCQCLNNDTKISEIEERLETYLKNRHINDNVLT